MASILLVDDEIVCRRYIPMFLTEDGHDVSAAATVEEALAHSEAHRPDILVTDWLLKDTRDGIDVARAVLARHPDLQIVFMTGLPPDQLTGSIEGLPVLGVLEKPLDLDALVTALRGLL